MPLPLFVLVCFSLGQGRCSAVVLVPLCLPQALSLSLREVGGSECLFVGRRVLVTFLLLALVVPPLLRAGLFVLLRRPFSLVLDTGCVVFLVACRLPARFVGCGGRGAPRRAPCRLLAAVRGCRLSPCWLLADVRGCICCTPCRLWGCSLCRCFRGAALEGGGWGCMGV